MGLFGMDPGAWEGSSDPMWTAMGADAAVCSAGRFGMLPLRRRVYLLSIHVTLVCAGSRVETTRVLRGPDFKMEALHLERAVGRSSGSSIRIRVQSSAVHSRTLVL